MATTVIETERAQALAAVEPMRDARATLLTTAELAECERDHDID